MNAVGRLGSYISRGVYTVSGPFHPFGGAVDIIVVEQEDGSFKSSPWYVRFGKFQGVLKTKEKVVSICVNGVEASFHMYLDHKGEAYFLKEGDVEEGESVVYPSSSGEDTDGQSSIRRPLKSKSCNYDAGEPNLVGQIDVSNGKIVARTSSRRSRIFGLFGRRSMKENSFREEEGGPEFVRSSSLERAEFAADLLEVQWSTNLATNKNRKDKTSRFSAQNALDGKADKDFQINGGQSQVNSFVHDSAENNSDHPVLHEETKSCNREMGNSCEPGFRESEHSVEKTSAQISCLSTLKQAIETSTSGGSSVEEACEVNSIISRKTDELGVGNADHDEDAKDAISKITISDSCISRSTELGACPSKRFDDEQVLDERDVVLPGQGVSKAETGINRVQSFLYCETSESSRLGLDGSGEQTHESLYVSHGECGEVHIHAQILHETTGQMSEANTLSESDVLAAKESSNSLEFLRDRDCCDFLNNATLESEVTSMNFVRNNVVSESLSSIDIHLITSNSVESLVTKVLEVTHQDTVTKRLAEDINMETEVVVEVRETQSQQTNPCNSCVPDYNDVELEEPRMVPESYTQMVSIDPICSVEEDELRSICTISSFRNSAHEVQHVENLRDENNMGQLQPSPEVSISPSESSEEEQFPFSDLDDFKVSKLQCTESTSPDCVENENHSSVTQEGIEVVNESLNKDYESYSSSDKLAQENLPNDFEDLVEKSGKISSPIGIPGSQKDSGVGVGRLVESLPNMWSYDDDLVACDLHLPCHSLDSNSKSLKWTLLGNTVSSCIKSDAEKEHQLAKEESTVEDIQTSGELNNVPINLAIEISLCKHLLREGMGADAASQAFDAEKLDMDKFSSVGPAIIKNDRLVVRINGHYFPWEAAAPIVLGMVAFGSEHIFEPQGMIPVDRVEKTRAGDPSKVIVDSSGRWGIWPFKRSRTIKAIQPGLNGTRSSDAESASESTSGMDGDKNVLKPIVTKKKLREITPTSEQLASLNLNEGKNTVTFTFSTAMLGEQQVEARIYMWKWNTRIVISDVDGTITKSDVLGQFMPLVGVDWSQTGVAHLFSAIKENGYQLLFLSARAISQAYHTRRFLFNIKQDGKALPDGPVVISPDGLFPSLIREVIRRAPHEFKIACLEDIRALFPCDCNPFYAGFGNRDTDEISYRKVGIPKGKIFIINPKGQVAVNRRVDTKSYTSLHTLVQDMFPPVSSTEQEDFNSWNYWRLPPPVFDI